MSRQRRQIPHLSDDLPAARCEARPMVRSPQEIGQPSRPPVSDEQYADWDEIYRDNVERLYRLMYSKVGNRPDAEDLTAEVFLAASSRFGPRPPAARCGPTPPRPPRRCCPASGAARAACRSPH